MEKSYSETKAEVLAKELDLTDSYILILKIKIQEIIKDVQISNILGNPLD
jgi:hypothetical protein